MEGSLVAKFTDYTAVKQLSLLIFLWCCTFKQLRARLYGFWLNWANSYAQYSYLFDLGRINLRHIDVLKTVLI